MWYTHLYYVYLCRPLYYTNTLWELLSSLLASPYTVTQTNNDFIRTLTHRHTHTWQIMGPKEHQSLSCNCYLRRLLLKANNGRREYHQVYISVGIMSGCKKSIAIAHTRVGYPNHSCRRRPSYRVSTERKKKFCVPFAVDGIACVPAIWTDKGKKTDEWMAWFIMMRDGLSHYLATFR